MTMDDKGRIGFHDLEPKDKVLTVAIVVLSVLILVLVVLQLCGVWEDSIKVYEPLMAVMFILQSRVSWRKNRRISYFYLAAAGFMLICAVMIIALG